MPDAKLDLGLVARALSGPGRDVRDSDLHEMSSLATDGDFIAAAERASSALERQATDIRVVCHFLLGAFIEQGPPALAPVLSSARSALDGGYSALRPTERKDRVIDNALTVLLRNIVGRVDYHDARRDATYQAWMAALSPQIAEDARDASSELRLTMERVLEKGRALDPLSVLDERISTFFSRRPAPKPAPAKPPAPAKEPEPEPEEELDADAPDADEPVPPPPEKSAAPERESPREPEDDQPGGIYLEPSAAFFDFLRRLDAFTRLLESGDMQRAAVVAEDVRRRIDGFDPRVHFPKLLTPFFRQLAAHVDAMAPFSDSMDSPQWRALEQLCQVDLEAFLGET